VSHRLVPEQPLREVLIEEKRATTVETYSG
jgi:hypothetical protein